MSGTNSSSSRTKPSFPSGVLPFVHAFVVLLGTVFSDYKMLSPQIWEEKGCVSYSLNVAYLARCGVGWGGGGGAGSQEQDHIFCFKIFFSYFPPLKLGCVLWSGVSYSPKNMVLGSKTKSYLPFLFFSAFLHSYCPPH